MRPASFDNLISVVCTFQPEEEENALLKFLGTLFLKEKSLEEWKKILEEEYGLKDVDDQALRFDWRLYTGN